jgi:transcriptional regulator with XRE-family HTH domain
MRHDPTDFFTVAQIALGLTQEQLGSRLGISRRTAQRRAGGGTPSYEVLPLIGLVYPHDPKLAAEMAASMGKTLEELGIGLQTPAAADVAAPPSLPSLPDGVVDAVVCAAAEAMELLPRDVRPGLLAALARAREIGVGAEQVERVLRDALAPPPPAPPPPSTRDARKTARVG